VRRIDRATDFEAFAGYRSGSVTMTGQHDPERPRAVNAAAQSKYAWLAGMSRASALEFSFFLSIPTMIAATGYTLLKSVMGKGENPIGVSQITSNQWLLLAIGFVVSYLVAYASVAFFMAWVRKRGFVPFAVYRIVVGILVLVFAARLAG
jgi:undecaprenyl-diphosphatase